MIYFSDDINFKKGNFSALFDVLDNENIPYKFDMHSTEYKKSWGRYSDCEITLQSNFKHFKNEIYKGFSVFDIAKYEILAACSTTEEWKHSKNYSNEDDFWGYIINSFPEFFSGCFKATKYWIDYWNSLDFKAIKMGVNFGGSLIYTRAFSAVMKLHNIPVFCTEHFFTGNDYYLEEKYDSLPNNSLIRHQEYIDRNLTSSSYLNKSDYLKKISNAKNKNVKTSPYLTTRDRFECLLICQVSNDFSILSESNKFKNSIALYKDFIDSFLDYFDGKLAIKSHPYEDKKLPSGITTTHDELYNYIDRMPPEKKKRIALYKNESLHGLIDSSSLGVVINSQSGIEVVMRGKPLVCFGNPFYSGKGFTYDFNNVESFFSHPKNFKLSSENIINLSNFLSGAFTCLVGKGEVEKVEVILKKKGLNISQKSKNDRAITPSLSKPIIRNKERNPTKPLSSLEVNEKKPIYSNTINNEKINKIKRLLAKFIRNPRQYCLDSKHPSLRRIATGIKR